MGSPYWLIARPPPFVLCPGIVLPSRFLQPLRAAGWSRIGRCSGTSPRGRREIAATLHHRCSARRPSRLDRRGARTRIAALEGHGSLALPSHFSQHSSRVSARVAPMSSPWCLIIQARMVMPLMTYSLSPNEMSAGFKTPPRSLAFALRTELDVDVVPATQFVAMLPSTETGSRPRIRT